jgi:glutamyl/glutaminyl-tRNA synthetase
MSSTAASSATVTRFAPSPTGYLHLGHVRSALEGWRAARREGGRFLLRLEDIDRTRCREAYALAILEDLDWLGLDWDWPVRRQSEHLEDYRHALDRLTAMGVLYPCFCTRREIQAEIAAAGGPARAGGPTLPGHLPGCRPRGGCGEAARGPRLRLAARCPPRPYTGRISGMARGRTPETCGSCAARRCRPRSQGDPPRAITLG